MIAGIDAGQTGIRAVLEGGRPGPQVPGVRRMEGSVGPDEVADALIVALASVIGARGAEVQAIGVGLSGYELACDGDLARIAKRLREAAAGGAGGSAGRPRGATTVAIASDGVTSLVGALGGARAGVVAAVGTGVVVLGHDGGDGWAKVDGWGALLGDDGSGFSIGHGGLRAALRAWDGREGGSAALQAAAEARWGSIDAVPTAILREDVAVSRAVASFAPAVADAAAAGDPVALAIWERGGDELAASVAAAGRRLFAGGTAAPVARLGNVWGAGALLEEPFERGLARRWPAARLVEAVGTSLDGAVELARPEGPAPVAGLLWRG